MNRVKRAFAVALMGLLPGLSGHLQATEARHLHENMDGKEASKFVSGMVSMLSYLQYRLGFPERGDCIDNWYYQTPGTPANVSDALWAYEDQHAEAIIYVLAKKACFEPQN